MESTEAVLVWMEHKRRRVVMTEFLHFRGDGILPTKGHADDAGFDLYVKGHHWIPAGEFRDLDCGVSVRIPDGYWGMITGRSSTIRNRGLLVVQGIIDAGYRGPLFAAVWNLRNIEAYINDGERLAQLLIFPNVAEYWQPQRVDELPGSARGNSGFGSTGR